VAATGGWFLLKPSAANAKRIAVLPFANLSGGQDQAYFAEGIAEELRSSLTRVGMEVIGRASSDAVKDLDTKAAASKLGVQNILTGSVRRSPQMVRINAQLVGGSDGVERWAQSYDRAPGDEIKIQTDIAVNVAQALSVALGQTGKAALTLGGSTNSGAQDLLLQAKKLFAQADGPDDLRAALALIDQALSSDPNYADAYVEKTNLLVQLAGRYGHWNTNESQEWADAEAAAKKAIELAPQLGTAYSALAELQIGRLDFANGLQNLNRAISLGPNNAEVLAIGARELPWISNAGEGLRLADEAIALDPLNGTSYQWRAYALVVLRRYRDAIAAGRKVLEVAPRQLTAHAQIGNSLIALNQLAAAQAEFQQMPRDHPLRMAGEGMIAARKGDIVTADRIVVRMRGLMGPARYQYGQIYVQSGNRDRAFAEFDKAAAAKTPGMIYFKADPLIEPIRHDPRYAELLKALKFPAS
jgi:serine/threonine-protein kinase